MKRRLVLIYQIQYDSLPNNTDRFRKSYHTLRDSTGSHSLFLLPFFAFIHLLKWQPHTARHILQIVNCNKICFFAFFVFVLSCRIPHLCLILDCSLCPKKIQIVKGNGFVCFKNNIVKGKCVLQKVNFILLLHKSVMYFTNFFIYVCNQTLPF